MGAEDISNVNPLMDKNLINAFIDGVQKTIEMMAMTEVKTLKPYVSQKAESNGDVAGMIGMVAGGMKGSIVIAFTKESIFKILENMLGETYTEVDGEVGDAVGELTNQIYGSAKTTLNEMGYGFEMAIPTVIRGSFQINSYHQGATLIIPFKLASEETFNVEINVQP